MLKDVLEKEVVDLEVACDEKASKLLEELSDACGIFGCGGVNPSTKK